MTSKNSEQGSAPFRILVVDDSEPFLRNTISRINKFPGFCVVGEAKDGAEAIQKVAALKPDLVVLDVGLPNFNGIEVATKIRLRSDCKILFLTGNSYPEIVREAFMAGANGYLVKVDAANELHTGLLAVVQGKQYVSTTLAGRR